MGFIEIGRSGNMIRSTNVLKNESREEEELSLENKSWWKIILYCVSFLLIFFVAAIGVDLLTGWI